ncbi:site-specific recombinase XerD [Pleurocapsa sp. PCC 7327]|uniref:tyrosine-type recombinase/integrase n=1 Tax=Pleurocapsa sp. PCC 7327 TaxID=118163 RepID=UPI00029FFF13|nr:tyrosine-type recombinase/integrase [Pleurocapsa sp. PCC 7327]AFY76834.1 site-specific recombinase XerD [Pleurocapsa sp. PCC 7327]
MNNSLKLASTLPSLASFVERDILQELLADKKSPNTRRTYAKSLRDFFQTITGDKTREPTINLVQEFLSLDRFSAISLVLKYKGMLVNKGLSPATINVRLCAIASLVNYARKIGKCDFTLEDVDGLKVQNYRDTTGIEPESFKTMISLPDTNTLKGKRDYAILRLLWDNALRRNEIRLANVKDFDPDGGRLWIQGKGKSQKEAIDLSPQAIAAIQAWIAARGKVNNSQPLFCTLDRATNGHRMSGNAIYKIVRNTAAAAGIKKIISPHRIRHSAITAALDATGGDTRKVQKLSRHADLNTLTRYDDNRLRHQKEVTTILADLI